MTDTKPVSQAAVKILQSSDAAAAHALVMTTGGDKNEWLPEAFVLLNTKGLSARQRREMTERICGSSSKVLADIGARVGVYGFSFPVWRSLTQCFNGASLAERFGMQRLKRETDIRDPALPEPHRHRLGPGYAFADGNTYIEYRRAYILCSQKTDEGTATLVIRNNSYYFGRDRLAAPAYVSWQPLSVKDLQALTEDKLENSFVRLQDAGNAAGMERIGNLLDALDAFEAKMDNWLKRNPGLEHLADFLRGGLDSPSPKPPYLAEIDPKLPPWSPQKVRPVTPETVASLSAIFNNAARGKKKIVLLSGPKGDYPTPV